MKKYGKKDTPVQSISGGDRGKTSRSVAAADIQSVRDRVLKLVQNNPQKAAVILNAWLNQPAKNTKKKAG